MAHRSHLAGLLTTLALASAALAQTPNLAGAWVGESLSLNLTISGSTVTGTCREPGGTVAGSVQGQLLPSRRALVATLTWPAGSGVAGYEIGLMLHPQAAVLNGSRWDQNTLIPTAIGLRREEPLLITPAPPRPTTPTAPPVKPTPPTTPPPANAQPITLFDNSNNAGVRNNPSKPTQFTLAKPSRVTYLRTYHYNGGAGATPGTIALRAADGKTYGPYPTKGMGKGSGTLQIMWFCEPNVDLPAGAYTVVDSQPATWSCNDASGSAGITWVSGIVR